jgi:hypothetical protein
MLLLQPGEQCPQFLFFLFRHRRDGTEELIVPVKTAGVDGKTAIDPLKVRRIC